MKFEICVCGHLKEQHDAGQARDCIFQDCGCTGYEKMKGSSKYGSIKVELDGYVFASRLEANRYLQLSLMEKAGEIRKLELQPRFQLYVNGVKIATYIADFQYVECKTGMTLVEDVKGYKTREYILKKKLVEALYHIKIQEITA